MNGKKLNRMNIDFVYLIQQNICFKDIFNRGYLKG